MKREKNFAEEKKMSMNMYMQCYWNDNDDNLLKKKLRWTQYDYNAESWRGVNGKKTCSAYRTQQWHPLVRFEFTKFINEKRTEIKLYMGRMRVIHTVDRQIQWVNGDTKSSGGEVMQIEWKTQFSFDDFTTHLSLIQFALPHPLLTQQHTFISSLYLSFFV